MNSKHIFMGMLCMLFLGLFLSARTYATDVLPATLESMTELSDTIVIGSVKSLNSYWEDKKIFTDVVITIQSFVKNAKSETAPEITLKMLGGTVGDTSLAIDSTPHFTLGEKVMLFLKEYNQRYVPFGFFYGVYRVTFDQVQKQERITGPFFQYPEHYDVKTQQRVPDRGALSKKDLNSFVEFVEYITTVDQENTTK